MTVVQFAATHGFERSHLSACDLLIPLDHEIADSCSLFPLREQRGLRLDACVADSTGPPTNLR
eukprot:2010551-Pyramimonas_sp.AAC.1